jgi:mRNA interferase RelE/StbE
MNKYTVVLTPIAEKQLSKLDKYTSKFIKNWIAKNLEGTTEPRQHGKPLTANRVGQWRYRIGDYRIICQIEDSKIIILILEIGHRRDIYL